MIALDNDLLKFYLDVFILGESIQKKSDEYKIPLTNFIRNLYLPIKAAVYQNKAFKLDQLKKQCQKSGIIEICDAKTDEELIKATKFKLMLTLKDTKINKYGKGIKINIMKDIRWHYVNSFEARSPREEAVFHIRSLLEGANKIEVIDRYLNTKRKGKKDFKREEEYLKYVNKKNTNEKKYLDLLKRIIPVYNKKEKEKRLIFYTEEKINHREEFGKNIIRLFSKYYSEENNYFVEFDEIKDEVHDRYIKAEFDKEDESYTIEIIITSGLIYLERDDKDMTYVVKIKDK